MQFGDELSMRILVVDDENDIREMMQEFFKKLGYSVNSAANGKEAIDLLRHQAYDIIFVDYYMPEKSGLEVIEYAKSRYTQVNIVVITGHPDMRESIAKFVGADEYLEKPLDLPTIEKIIAKVQSSSRPSRDLRDLEKENFEQGE